MTPPPNPFDVPLTTAEHVLRMDLQGMGRDAILYHTRLASWELANLLNHPVYRRVFDRKMAERAPQPVPLTHQEVEAYLATQEAEGRAFRLSTPRPLDQHHIGGRVYTLSYEYRWEHTSE